MRRRRIRSAGRPCSASPARWLASAVVATGVAFTTTQSISQSASGVVLNEVSTRVARIDLANLLDEDGSPHGFVELFNAGTSSRSVGGWSIRADGGAGGSWTLPTTSIAPGETLRIWTSGKNRSTPGAPLHADFVLDAASFVSLHDVGGTLVDEVPLAMPVDHSFGRCGDAWYYFSKPTPGALNEASSLAPIVVLNDPVSLTVDRPHQLVALPVDDETWTALDPRVTVDASGTVRLLDDVLAPIPPTLAVEARSALLKARRSVTFTPVPWTSNVSALVPSSEILPADQILGADASGVYFSRGANLYRSSDGMTTSELIAPLPVALASDSQLRSTPFGHFLRSGPSVRRSMDLSSWTTTFSTTHRSLRGGFDVFWDPLDEVGSVVVAEHSTDPNARHSVYVGTFPTGGSPAWRNVAEFGSINEGLADPTRLDVARHVHAAAIDPHTGDVWVGTGDSDLHSRILTGPRDAQELDLLGFGSQAWRTLAIWFSPTHVYWNMDTTSTQSIWRVSRAMRDPISGWPSMTPELASGTTRPGVRYMVTADASDGRFPVAVGQTWTETGPRALDPEHRVRPLNDPAFDYREHVATLDSGSHWFQLWVDVEGGKKVSLVATSAEGNPRDRRGRVFGLEERADGTVDVQELVSVDPSPYFSPFVQLEPIAQDPLGYVYLEGRMTERSLYRMRLNWRDDKGSPTGGQIGASLDVVAPSPPQCLAPVPEPKNGVTLLAGIQALGLIARRGRQRAATAESNKEPAVQRLHWRQIATALMTTSPRVIDDLDPTARTDR